MIQQDNFLITDYLDSFELALPDGHRLVIDIHRLITLQEKHGRQTRPVSIELPTAREIDVLRYLARGYTNRQIAAALFISVRTVESHRSNLMAKLNRRGRAELVRYAREMGYL